MLGHIESESAENYLETIYLLTKDSSSVRAVDIANQLSLSRASVSRALSILKSKELILVNDGFISLTEDGVAEATRVLRIHKLLVNLFMIVAGVSHSTADVDACRIEHVVSSETVTGISEFLINNKITEYEGFDSESHVPVIPIFSESAENYLETILVLKENLKDKVRAINIAKELGVSRASVSTALSQLRDKQCIISNEQGYISFTKLGFEIAQKIYSRHVDLSNFFVNVLQIDKAVAHKDACRIEHLISDETISGIRAYMLNNKG
jgi:DtxR family transcriptional regulator, Mn-dependent transcriptional regulator